jgi:hypothetical protein
MRITCDRCGKDRMLNEAHTAHRDLPILTILDRKRHDGCGAGQGGWNLITGIEGASSLPVRKITLIEGGSTMRACEASSSHSCTTML